MDPDRRTARIERKTRETQVTVELDLDGRGSATVDTGLGFADHMLGLLAFWAGWDLSLSCRGDLEVDAHHSIEDAGLCLGEALAKALGDKAGICRMGQARVPMDEALAEAVVDLSGRPFLVYDDRVAPALVGGEEKALWREFFKSLAFRAGMNLHLRMLYGENGHHLLEAAMKALGAALARAAAPGRAGTPSTKGSLD